VESLFLLQDIAVVLVVAGFTGWIFRRIGLSVVVGYLAAGILIGPYTPPFALVEDVQRVQTLSQLGLVFLMFFVGMGLNLRRLQRLGFGLFLATSLGAMLVFIFTQGFASLLGWPPLEGLFLAAMLMVSSSAIITKTLSESGLAHEKFAQRATGMTVMEDVVAVVMLTVLTSRVHMVSTAQTGLAKALWLLAGFVVLVVVIGLLFLPRLLRRLRRSSDSDLITVLVCGLLFAAGVLAAKAGYSVALGAFLFGMVAAETRLKHRLETSFAPLQDIFSAIFFVSIGMLIDMRLFWDHIGLILGISLFALAVRIVAAATAFIATGVGPAGALKAAFLVTPIGEFSYIIAQLGTSCGAVPEAFGAIAVGVSIVTAATIPLLARHVDAVTRRVLCWPPESWFRGLEAYRQWIYALESRSGRSQVGRLTRGRLGQMAVELLLVAGLLGYAHPLYEWIDFFIKEGRIFLPGWKAAYWVAVVGAAVALMAALWRNVTAVSMIYAEAARSKDGGNARLLSVMQSAFRFLSAVGCAWLFWMIAPLHTPNPLINTGIILLLLLFLLVFWRRLIRWHSQFQVSLNEALAVASAPAAVFRNTARKVVDPDEWEDVDLAECVLPEDSAAVGRSISDLDFRARYGCSVVEVQRQGVPVPNPPPEFVLYPGDRLLVLGQSKPLGQVQAFLAESVPGQASDETFAETSLEAVEVPEDTPRVQQSLADLKVYAKTGVQVLGIERGGRKILNPGGNEMLFPGDRLLVLATPEEKRRFEDWLAPAENTGEPPIDSAKEER
jgi:CPA2 family monovalent cation:H+ antiporter-2